MTGYPLASKTLKLLPPIFNMSLFAPMTTSEPETPKAIPSEPLVVSTRKSGLAVEDVAMVHAYDWLFGTVDVEFIPKLKMLPMPLRVTENIVAVDEPIAKAGPEPIPSGLMESCAHGEVVPRPSLPVEESNRNPPTPALPKRTVEEAFSP